jgi:GNAT superfamily N-acetyltransferase
MPAEIRPPRRGDLPSLFDCVRTYEFHLLTPGSVADPGFPDDAILAVRNRVVEVDLQQRCSVAVDGGTVLGFCCWAWLDEAARAAKTVLICVRPEARRLGLGSRLQERRMQEMREQGARELHTWSVDPESVRWYESHFGYRALGEEPLRHALHRWYWEGESFWGIHRGFRQRDMLTHLVTDLTAMETAS